MDRVKRIQHIDLGRFIAILLVVIGHSGWFQLNCTEAYRFIYLFHMPVFFFLSGLVYKNKPFVEVFRSRFERLLIPFFFVGLFGILLSVARGKIDLMSSLFGLLWATGYTLPWIPLWFLPTLFAVSLFGWLIIKFFQSGARLLILIVVCFVAQYVFLNIIPYDGLLSQSGRPIGLPWGVDIVPFCLAFFLLGKLVSGVEWPILLNRNLYLSLGLAIVVLFLIFESGASLDINYRRFLPYLFVLIGSLAGVAAIFCLSLMLARFPVAGNVGHWFAPRGMVVYLLHSPILVLLTRFFPQTTFGAALAILLAIFIPLGLYDFVIKKSRLLSLLFGNSYEVPSSVRL